MSELRYEMHGQIGVVALKKLPPGAEPALPLEERVIAILARLNADSGVKAVVFHAIQECPFGVETRDDWMHLGRAIDAVEASEKPVVCLVADGCSDELLAFASGCHYRVAPAECHIVPTAVRSGLLPAAGITQRLPRLIGGTAAAELLQGAAPAPVAEYSGSLFDRLADHDPLAAAIALAREVPDAGLALRRAGNRQYEHRQTCLHPYPGGGAAGQKCVECIRAADLLPLPEGLALEARALAEVDAPTTSPALRYADECEANTARPSDSAANTPARPLRSVAIVGAGMIGAGIALNFLEAGIPVTLLDRTHAKLEEALASIRETYDRSVGKGRQTPAERDRRSRLISVTLDYADIADTDLVIEAVFEEIEVKKAVFRKLDEVMKAGAILATCTSTLDVGKIANFTRRPEEVVGLHFVSPAHIMRLLEIVPCRDTSDEVLGTAIALGATLGKRVVVSGVGDGLLGNRLLDQYWRQALFLVDEGASVEQIDRAMEAWGMIMGPFRMMDLVGNDLHWAIRRRHYVEQPQMRYSRIADKLCELGHFGQKTHAGWYRYHRSERSAASDSTVHALIDAHRDEIGVTPRQITDGEIVDRLVFSLINEGSRILEAGIAQCPADIDAVYVGGYGFPRQRGGPMYHADQVGLDSVRRALEGFAAQAVGDPAAWIPASLLVRLAAEGRTFHQLARANCRLPSSESLVAPVCPRPAGTGRSGPGQPASRAVG